MNLDILKREIADSLKNNKVYIIKDVFNNTPNWDNFVNFMDLVGQNKYNKTETRTEPFGYNNENKYLRIADCVDPINHKSNGDSIPQLDEVLNILEQIFDEKTKYGEIYINFTSKTKVLSPHNDPWIAVVWSCIGQIDWRIYSDFNLDSQIESYITNPGDIIIIPKGMIHSVVPLTPRASISLAYNSDIDIKY